MANGASYLTPQFLMSQLNQLLRVDRAGAKKGVGTALTKDEFKDKYYTGEIDPGGQGRSRLYYDFNFGDDFGGKYYDNPRRSFTEIFTPNSSINTGAQGYRFYDHNDAYDAYLDSLGGDFGQLEAYIFDPASFLGGVEKAQGIGSANKFSPDTFRPFTVDMFKDLRTEAYQPVIEEGRSSFIDDLVAGKANVASMGRGVAGSGRRDRARQDLSRQYTQNVENIYSDIQGQKASALQNILDVASQYENLTGA